MSAPLVLRPAHSGRFAIGPSNLGFPVVVQLVRSRGRWYGICHYGLFKGREMSLSSPWKGAALLDATDAVRLDEGAADAPRPIGGKVGVVRGDAWVVLSGDEADAAWCAAGDGGVTSPGGGVE